LFPLLLEHLFDSLLAMVTPTELRQHLVHFVRQLQPETMTGNAAAAAVVEFATIEKAAATARMFAAVRVAQTDAWRGKGHATAADWLAATAGITVRQAAAQLGTARKADRLPKTKEQMRKGKLSPTQAGAVADGATADPDAEDSLLDAADRGTTADLQAKAAQAKAAATDSATRERRIRSERTVRTRTDAEGAFCLWLRGPAADGARLTALMKPFEEHAFRHGRSSGARDSYENRSYDAFFTLLAWLQEQAGQGSPLQATPSSGPSADSEPGAAPDADDSSPEAGTPRRAGGRGAAPHHPADPPLPVATDRRAASDSPHPLPTRLPGGNNVKVIVVIDHTALLRGHTVAGETCEIAGLGPISVEAARQILRDDPFLAVVVRRGRDVVNVAHHGRGLNAHQRTAIEANGLRCANIACNRTVAIQIDHRHPYGADPITQLHNQDPLCPDCHRKKTHHGWHLEPGVGRRRLVPAADQPPRSEGGPRGPAAYAGSSQGGHVDEGSGDPGAPGATSAAAGLDTRAMASAGAGPGPRARAPSLF
jgi:hypothetical protein